MGLYIILMVSLVVVIDLKRCIISTTSYDTDTHLNDFRISFAHRVLVLGQAWLEPRVWRR